MNSKKSLDERGMVSFLITMVMMAVITLIVIGFTQVTNQNRRQALDRQLSNQAFYAAESGVNSIKRQIDTALSNGQPIPTQTTCNGGQYTIDPALAPGVEYTCVLVNRISPDIRKNVTQTNSAVVYLRTVDSNGADIIPSEISMAWNPDGSGVNNCPNPDVTPVSYPTDGTCITGMLRLDIFKVAGLTTPYNADMLKNNTRTIFFWPPKVFSATKIYTVLNNTQIVYKGVHNCESIDRCTARVSLDPSWGSGSEYYLRMSSVYGDLHEVIVDAAAPGNTDLSFIGQQVSVDVTGKSQGVLRRIQTRINLNGNDDNSTAMSAIQSDKTVCKLLSVGTTDVRGDECATD